MLFRVVFSNAAAAGDDVEETLKVELTDEVDAKVEEEPTTPRASLLFSRLLRHL